MDKKIFLVLSIFAIVAVGCVYAAEASTATVKDVDFTIPEGFSENTDDAIVDETYEEDGQALILNAKTFEKDDQSIILSVLEYDDNVTDDMVEDAGDEFTISGIPGFYVDGGVVKMFSYIDGNKVVSVTTFNDPGAKILHEVLG